MKSVTCSKAYISRISDTIRQFLLFQSFQILFFIILINFSIIHPVKWLNSILDKGTSVTCWLCFILNTLLLFGMTVRYSKNYTSKCLLVASRFSKLKNLFSMNSQCLILISAIFGLVNVLLYLLLSDGFYNDSNEEYFMCLTKNRYIILGAGPFMAVHYFVKYNFKEDIVQYPIIQRSIGTQIRSKLKTVICSASRLSMSSVLLYIILYCVFGYQITDYWNSLFLTEDISFSFTVCLDKNLLVYLFTFSVFFNTTMLMMHELFVINLTQPIEFPIDEEKAHESDLLMKNALHSEIPLIKMLAFQDLYSLTERNAKRRLEIYAITFPGGQGQNWKDISTQCMSLLEGFIDGLTKTYPKLESTKASLYDNAIRRHNFIMPGALNLRAYPNQVLDSKADLKPKMTMKESILKTINNLPLMRYFFGDESLLALKQILSESQILIWANLSLTMLLTMALSEDHYGVTQNDFPKIVGLLLKLRDALSSVHRMKLYKSASDNNNLPVSMNNALEVNVRSCLYMLSIEYKPYLSKMKLDDDIKQKLCRYNEWTET